MTPDTAKYLDKAERAIEAARKLLEIHDTEGGMNRAYYAMFYVAEALLCEQGLSFSKHAGVHSALVSILPRRAYSTPSSTSGCWPHSTSGSLPTTA